MDCFSLLPEGCISDTISLTSPKDACRSSAISSGFESAADSDTVWEYFLPSDYLQIISRSVSPPPVFSTKKQLYFRLCDSPPILLHGGKLSFALDKETGKKCFALPAPELSISWGDSPQYWSWISLPESRFWEVARLRSVCWLDIWGKMKTKMLSPKTTYAAYLIFKIVEKYSGLESIPVKVSVRFVGEIEDGIEEDYGSTVYLRLRTDRPVPEEHNGRLPEKREDGWMEIELGEFFNDEEGDDDGEVEMRLREVKNLNWKSGLIIKSIELRPKVLHA